MGETLPIMLRRGDMDLCQLIGDNDGVLGYMSLIGRRDRCPKSLPMRTQVACLGRKMLSVAIEGRLPARRLPGFGTRTDGLSWFTIRLFNWTAPGLSGMFPGSGPRGSERKLP